MVEALREQEGKSCEDHRDEYLVRAHDSQEDTTYFRCVWARDRHHAYAQVMDDYPRWYYCDGVDEV